ncbi:hypothetical protein [Candidatus Poriferisocius sp.]|uniref:hypothetical protein n=1 Tax=Candidatus Poriferisocius sp. TaxID=3101276 RepID=UPI003B025EBD
MPINVPNELRGLVTTEHQEAYMAWVEPAAALSDLLKSGKVWGRKATPICQAYDNACHEFAKFLIGEPKPVANWLMDLAYVNAMMNGIGKGKRSLSNRTRKHYKRLSRLK